MDNTDIEALVANVNESVQGLEEELTSTQVTLNAIASQLSALPDYYIPRKEADVKASRIRTALVGFLISGLAVASGLVALYYKEQDICHENRTFHRDLINIAVADRQPLPTSTPEMVLAIEEHNKNVTRPLRERLLSLDGAQPETC